MVEPKITGEVRVCGDYSFTVNPVNFPDLYPLSRINDLLASLAGWESFTKLDLSSAYQQVELDKESKELLTFNTPWGLFQCNRPPFGVSKALAILQRIMDSLLQGVPGNVVYLDSVLVTMKSRVEYLRKLELVLGRLAAASLRLKTSKCALFVPVVDYLGQKIDQEGLHPTDSWSRQSRTHRPQKCGLAQRVFGFGELLWQIHPAFGNEAGPAVSATQKRNSVEIG